jgi:hypothetical protein
LLELCNHHHLQHNNYELLFTWHLDLPEWSLCAAVQVTKKDMMNGHHNPTPNKGFRDGFVLQTVALKFCDTILKMKILLKFA